MASLGSAIGEWPGLMGFFRRRTIVIEQSGGVAVGRGVVITAKSGTDVRPSICYYIDRTKPSAF
jgi:hypothetical protein